MSRDLWSPRLKATILLAEPLTAALLAAPMFAQVTPTDEKVPCRNYKDVLALFDRLGYTKEACRRASARSRASTSRKCAIRGASGARRSPLSPTRKGSFPAPRPDRVSHQRAHPRGSGPREGTDRAPRPRPERDTGGSSLADRTRGEVPGPRIDEQAARQRRLPSAADARRRRSAILVAGTKGITPFRQTTYPTL